VTYVVDTHSLVWFLERNPRLGSHARDALRDPAAELVIPTIVLAEVAFLYARQRIAIDLPGVLAHIASAPNCAIYPLDEAVVERLPTTLDIHDAVIVATAIVLRDALGRRTALITKDTAIEASGLVEVVW